MTKKRIAFVTDSTVCLTEELRNHPDVYIVPIVVISEGKEYEDGVNLSSDQLYEIIRSSKVVPGTSQPSVGKFEQLYAELKENYDQAISIHVSGKLSGTYANSMAAKDQIDFDVEVVDSSSLSFAITELINKGMELAEQDLDVHAIAEKLRERVAKSRNLILLGSLEQLYKGGRMSGAQFLLGNVLKIKPILRIETNGELGLYQRVRSEAKAITKLVDLLKQSCKENTVKQVGLMHGNELKKATELKQKIEEAISGLKVVIGEISSSLAVHAGEGSIAIFWTTE